MRRLMGILNTLEANPGGLSAKELARITGHPEAVILKDLNGMSAYTDLGSYFTLYSDEDEDLGDFTDEPVTVSDPGVKWYVLINEELYPALNLSSREALALAWFFAEFPPLEELNDLWGVLEDHLLSGQEVAVVREMAGQMCALGGVVLQESRYVDMLREAVLNEKQVIIKYYAKNWGRVVQWRLWPLGLVFHTENGVWYLLALRGDTSQAVACHCDRIQKLQVLEDKFEYPADFSLAGYLKLRWGMDLSELEMVRVRLYDEANVIEKVKGVFKSKGLPEPVPVANGALEYHGKIHGIFNFSKWLLSLGSSAQVLEPRWLREDMIRIAREWCMLYGRRDNNS